MTVRVSPMLDWTLYECLPEHGIGLTLSRIVDVRIRKKVLDPKKDLTRDVNKIRMRMNDWRTCLIVIAGFQDFSSSKIDRQTVPDG